MTSNSLFSNVIMVKTVASCRIVMGEMVGPLDLIDGSLFACHCVHNVQHLTQGRVTSGQGGGAEAGEGKTWGTGVTLCLSKLHTNHDAQGWSPRTDHASVWRKRLMAAVIKGSMISRTSRSNGTSFCDGQCSGHV